LFADNVYGIRTTDKPIATEYTDWDPDTNSTTLKQLVISPVFQVLRDPTEPGAPAHNQTMYIGVTFVFNPVILTLFTNTETVKYVVGLTFLIIVLTLAAIFLWMTVHSFIQPMRLLNARM
jgi:hypothetical protein